ncbi:phosphohydrolase [Pseudoxanthomonas sacheonensis]|nr:phosphohydrolase [Pseudoxanthomonas sacheonensis]
MDFKNVIVIYHGNCADGFTAAWAAWRFFGDDAEYYAGIYQADPPDVKGRDVVLVDFCYKPETMRQMQLSARSILVLDHHKSASEDLPDLSFTNEEHLTVIRMDSDRWTAPRTWNYVQGCVIQDQWEGIRKAIIYAYFDMDRSGAGIAWDFFHPCVPRPALVNHVEDRDLWRFALPGTREVQATVFSYEYSFTLWDRLAAIDPAELRKEGEAIERKHHKDVAELVRVCQRRMTIAGHDVPVASLPYTLVSDAGHLMAQGEDFAACYWDLPDGRQFGLRSVDGGTDVSQIARHYGGGGHANAAGFKVPRTHELAAA